MSWSPTNAYLFASGSDDTQVKLWSVQHVEATIVTKRSRKRANKANSGEESKTEVSARKKEASGARSSGYCAQVSLDEESDKSKERSDDDSSSSSSSWDESDNWVQPSANGNR